MVSNGYVQAIKEQYDLNTYLWYKCHKYHSQYFNRKTYKKMDYTVYFTKQLIFIHQSYCSRKCAIFITADNLTLHRSSFKNDIISVILLINLYLTN